MTDLVLLLLKAGRGGDGRVSFLRAKSQPKGGPDGGMGGDGGDVLVRLNPHLASLTHLAGVKQVAGTVGQNGGPQLQRGHAGKNAVVDVPPGTHIWQVVANEQAIQRVQKVGIKVTLQRPHITFERFAMEYVGGPRPLRPEDGHIDSEITEHISINRVRPQAQGWELLGIIDEHTPELVVCQGGFGGRGNDSFKSATNRTPLQAEWGSYGEERVVVFEHKLLADIGLVGLPNAGKSTLLSVLTKARPKIGSYPFTTLEPHLGVLSLSDARELVLADIPGLIEGASEGKGLGYDFLRHVEHSAALVFIVAPEEIDLLESREDGEELARRMARQLRLLRAEAASYDSSLLEKPWIIVLNKIDLLTTSVVQKVTAQLKLEAASIPVVSISAGTKMGISELLETLSRLHQQIISQKDEMQRSD